MNENSLIAPIKEKHLATYKAYVIQVMYGRKLELQPAPKELTYLIHAPADSDMVILTHYISTGGASGFDHVLTVNAVHG